MMPDQYTQAERAIRRAADELEVAAAFLEAGGHPAEGVPEFLRAQAREHRAAGQWLMISRSKRHPWTNTKEAKE